MVRETGLLIGSWSRGYVEKYVQKIASALYIHIEYTGYAIPQTEILPAGFLPCPQQLHSAIHGSSRLVFFSSLSGEIVVFGVSLPFPYLPAHVVGVGGRWTRLGRNVLTRYRARQVHRPKEHNLFSPVGLRPEGVL